MAQIRLNTASNEDYIKAAINRLNGAFGKRLELESIEHSQTINGYYKVRLKLINPAWAISVIELLIFDYWLDPDSRTDYAKAFMLKTNADAKIPDSLDTQTQIMLRVAFKIKTATDKFFKPKP